MARVTLRRLLSAALLLLFITTSVHLISNQPRRSDASDFSAATKAWTAALAEIDSAEAKQRQAKVGFDNWNCFYWRWKTGAVRCGGRALSSRVGCLLPVEFGTFLPC
ncbi:hypothetical protein BCR33DRAFT_724516 [Rhizoclosmatium globosum]|uniref:Uncharacterized protein n=1 Tax=Rhizoclosmatium globosum TaxID=329046 RepID=A0A1Y2B4X4_9FUNG|nr:hypothetical protein BCR33DRAFT_724516 [Rhizoclosmatium globosum]|eukprot:ORY29882.1 hypothetical protein BCR33DRAFT_724516 [Rhizoclosmatium globosum]